MHERLEMLWARGCPRRLTSPILLSCNNVADPGHGGHVGAPPILPHLFEHGLGGGPHPLCVFRLTLQQQRRIRFAQKP